MAVTDISALRNVADGEEPEEFLQPEEKTAMSGEDKDLGKTNVDPTYHDQDAENILHGSSDGYKFKIVNSAWAPYARALWKKFSELHDCNPANILFIEVEEGKAKSRGKAKIMEISRVPARWQELLEQMVNFHFSHIITIYQRNVDKFEQSREQMLVHLYNCLRQIKADGTLRDFDIRAFSEVYANLKIGWDKEHCAIPNLIETGNWIGMKQLQGQLFGEDRSGENAQAKDF